MDKFLLTTVLSLAVLGALMVIAGVSLTRIADWRRERRRKPAMRTIQSMRDM